MSQARAERRRQEREKNKTGKKYDLTRQSGSVAKMFSISSNNDTFTLTRNQLQDIFNREIEKKKVELLQENALDIFIAFAYAMCEEYKLGHKFLKKIYPRFCKESEAMSTGHLSANDIRKVLKEEYNFEIK